MRRIKRLFCRHRNVRFNSTTGAHLTATHLSPGVGQNVEVGVVGICNGCGHAWTGDVLACAPINQLKRAMASRLYSNVRRNVLREVESELCELVDMLSGNGDLPDGLSQSVGAHRAKRRVQALLEASSSTSSSPKKVHED